MCEECDIETYEAYECCASGSCEVCRGAQGRLRLGVKRLRHPPVPPTADRMWVRAHE